MKCPSPITIKNKKTDNNKDIIEVSCGKCGACISNKRNEWSFRIKQEVKQSLISYFVTMTYTDNDLPHTEEGEVTLCKRDIQLFMKKLRKAQDAITDLKIRYYVVGEYGTNTERPHYHAILCNVVDDVARAIPFIWKNGLITIDYITPARIHYVTKYHTVPFDKKTEKRQKPFALMSKGIGKSYINNNEKWHKENQYHHVINNGYKQNIPKYYKDKIFSDIEKQKYSESKVENMDKKYNEKLEKYYKMGYENPLKEIRQEEINQAKAVKEKSTEKGKGLF